MSITSCGTKHQVCAAGIFLCLKGYKIQSVVHLQKFSEGTERSAEAQGRLQRHRAGCRGDLNGSGGIGRAPTGRDRSQGVTGRKGSSEKTGAKVGIDVAVLGRAGAACCAGVNRAHRCH